MEDKTKLLNNLHHYLANKLNHNKLVCSDKPIHSNLNKVFYSEQLALIKTNHNSKLAVYLVDSKIKHRQPKDYLGPLHLYSKPQLHHYLEINPKLQAQQEVYLALLKHLKLKGVYLELQPNQLLLFLEISQYFYIK